MARRNGYATFSDCGFYRYELGGDIGETQSALFASTDTLARLILWIMLNPSKANAQKNDQTVDTIIRFSELWGFTGLIVGNLYAYIATDPKDLKRTRAQGLNVVGIHNDIHLMVMIRKVRASGGRIMAAWGANADPDRARAVHVMAGEMYCLKTNQDGSPIHPLYQPMNSVPTLWEGMP